jgi:CDP-4-dehydro-6-deoxyglucose reductase
MPYTLSIPANDKRFSLSDNEPLLDAAMRNGVLVPYSCRGGSCGACEAILISGEVAYPNDKLPPALSEESANKGLVLMCQARARSNLSLAVKERPAAAIPARPYPARIAKMRRAADDVMIVHLQLPPNQRMEFVAGQYLDVLLPNCKRRSFSMANSPDSEGLIELHIRQVAGGLFTEPLFTTTKEKSVLRLEAPYGTFCFDYESANTPVFVAGGTGLAPIQSIVDSLINADFDRPIHIFWGVRSDRDIYASETLERWSTTSGITLNTVLSEPSSDWSGDSGWVTDQAARLLETSPESFDVYMAGPPPMVEAGRNTFTDLGLDSSRIRCDSFDYAADA